MPHVYILECSDGGYYTGSRGDLAVRLAQYQAGEGVRYTARRSPVALVYSEHYDRIDEAFRREKQVQGWSRKKKRALIAGRFEELPGL